MNLLFHLRYMGALVLSGIIGLLLESWILKQSNSFLLVIHQVKRGTRIGKNTPPNYSRRFGVRLRLEMEEIMK